MMIIDRKLTLQEHKSCSSLLETSTSGILEEQSRRWEGIGFHDEDGGRHLLSIRLETHSEPTVIVIRMQRSGKERRAERRETIKGTEEGRE